MNACVVPYFEPFGNAPDESFPFVPKVHKVPWGSLGLTNDNCYSILSYLFRKLKSLWSVKCKLSLLPLILSETQVTNKQVKKLIWGGITRCLPGARSIVKLQHLQTFGPIFYFVYNPSILVCEPLSFISPFNDNARKAKTVDQDSESTSPNPSLI